jgi:poly(3-hydroxybutyrate) depolymerase
MAAVLAFCAVSSEGAQTEKGPMPEPAPEKPRSPKNQDLARHTLTIASSKDGAPQKILFQAPPEAGLGQRGDPVPLLVALHTWSSGYDQCVEYLPLARERKWVMVAPDFRGPNNRPQACASDQAVQDVIDAVEHARKNARVDGSRIYLFGASGGGHMALMMAA